MNHSEAVERMAVERYLLNELAPDVRDAFEEHVFDCPECALDLRAGAVFVQEAKAQLPAITTGAPGPAKPFKSIAKPSFRLSWWRPAFVAPAFAALLLVLVYQNVVTFPALRSAATQPRLVPMAPLRSATRGVSHITVTADRVKGVALQVDLPFEPGIAPAASYSFDLLDPQGKPAFSASIPATANQSAVDRSFSLFIPGSKLRNGTYSLTVTSVAAHGERTPIEKYIFDIVIGE
jgi:hypothetical protein